jgi:hypothetical protein
VTSEPVDHMLEAVRTGCRIIAVTTVCASIGHWAAEGGAAKGRVPLHFGVFGEPSTFTSPRGFVTYPLLAIVVAAGTMLKPAEGAGSLKQRERVTTATCVVTAASGLVVLYAQRAAARIAAGEEQRMQHTPLLLAFVGASLVPLLWAHIANGDDDH